MTQPINQLPPAKGPSGKLWALLALGFVVTLLVGLAIGLRLRPNSAVVSVAITPDVKGQTSAAANPTPSAEMSGDGNAVAPNADFMTFLLSDARHIEGDANAPVAIVEFSDFK